MQKEIKSQTYNQKARKLRKESIRDKCHWMWYFFVRIFCFHIVKSL